MIRQFPEPDLFTLNCPTQQVLDIVAHKWVVIILYCLAYGPKRYGEIHRRIDGISQKVLTDWGIDGFFRELLLMWNIHFRSWD